jgi:hypothetical protein
MLATPPHVYQRPKGNHCSPQEKGQGDKPQDQKQFVGEQSWKDNFVLVGKIMMASFRAKDGTFTQL